MAEPTLKPVRYLGRFLHSVGSSHRIKLPSTWRLTDWPSHFFVLPWPVHECNHLLVLTEPRWNRMSENLETYSLADDEVTAVERHLFGTVTEADLDSSGRLVLPAEGFAQAGIGAQVRLVGLTDKFEIWNPQTLEAVEAESKARIAGIVKRIQL